MIDELKKIDETSDFIKGKIKVEPKIAIILGTGLGGFDKEVKSAKKIPYDNIPNFPNSTVTTHKGELLSGIIEGKNVICFSGRFHYYEGWSLQEITFPVRVAKNMGCEILIISNASGGLNKFFSPGDIMIIYDHINFMGVNPLIGPHSEKLGPRFPDMSEPYDKKLIKIAEEAATELKIPVKRGVYVAVTGPNLETAAEYRMFHLLGADAVGMSTVPEVIVAVQCGLRVLGISVITDVAKPDVLQATSLDEIIKIASSAEPKMRKLVGGVIKRL